MVRRNVQPTEIQVQQCLRVLEAETPELPRWPDGEHIDAGGVVPDGLVELLRDVPALRLQAVADARMRLAGGVQPTADDLADRLVGRMVCDRIR
jgi:hypothetical protein